MDLKETAVSAARDFCRKNQRALWTVRDDLTDAVCSNRCIIISRTYWLHKKLGYEIVMAFYTMDNGDVCMIAQDARDFSIACGGHEYSMQVAAAQSAYELLRRKRQEDLGHAAESEAC